MKRFKININCNGRLFPDGFYIGSIWAEDIARRNNGNVQFLVKGKVVATIWESTEIKVIEEVKKDVENILTAS